MATNYPTSLDTSSTTLRTDIASTDDLDASGKEHDVQHVNANGAAIALETKLGTGASTPAKGSALVGNGAGSSTWLAVGSNDQVLTADSSQASGVKWAAAGAATSIADADGDTKIQTEESSDEDKIRFDTAGTERAVLDSAGLEIKSGGVKMDGLNSADNNTLDDYEQGTWTCALTASTSGTITIDTGNDLGYYTKVGRVVHVQGAFEVSSVSSPAGTLRVGGLPFTSTGSVSEGPDMGNNMGTVVNLANAKTGIITKLHPNGTFMDMNAGGGGTSEDASLADDVDSGTYFLISGTYVAAT